MKPMRRMGWSVLAAALLVVACRDDPRQAAPAQATPRRAEAVEPLSTTVTEAFVGVVVAAQRADLAARADGLVLRVTARLGTRVEAGELIAELDASELRARRASVEAALDAARAREVVARARSTSSATTLERYRSSADIVSAQDLTAVETEHEIAVGELAEAEAEVRRLTAELRSADDLVEQHRVRAPFAGLVAGRHLDPGNWVA
ncbi:MAG: biotin/lipoyl-binding protein, partial [Acidobacteriota bacterium]